MAEAWMRGNADRFGRALLVRHAGNAGLALTRNTGFANSESAFVFPLDADNVLLPRCLQDCLAALEASRCAFAYPEIQCFGDTDEVRSRGPFLPERLVGGNYIDAMALVRKSAWAAVGGYDHIPCGWEDYDFWCKLVEAGFQGRPVPEILARYRVHQRSMSHTQSNVPANRLRMIDVLERRHPWLRLPREA